MNKLLILGIILSETEVPHYKVVFESRYFQRGVSGGKRQGDVKIWPSNLTCKAYKILRASGGVNPNSQYVSEAFHSIYHLFDTPKHVTVLSVPLDKSLLASESHSSSIQRKSQTRDSPSTIYPVLESSPWNYTDSPLVAMLYLGALILCNITLPKTPQGSEL